MIKTYITPLFCTVYSWKLSKTRAGLSEAANNVINELVSKNIDLHERYYEKTGQDHAACFYYPVFDEIPLSIELPGPCDESITGVPNFNVNDVSCHLMVPVYSTCTKNNSQNPFRLPSTRYALVNASKSKIKSKYYKIDLWCAICVVFTHLLYSAFTKEKLVVSLERALICCVGIACLCKL